LKTSLSGEGRGVSAGWPPLADAMEIEKNQNPHRKELWLHHRIEGYTSEPSYVNRIFLRLTMAGHKKH
jgi:hypothetical protein